MRPGITGQTYKLLDKQKELIMGQKKRFLSIFFPVMAVYISACGRVSASSGDHVPRVKLVPVEQRRLAGEVSGFGALSFLTKVDVSAAQNGVIRRLYYREGDAVPRGARIVQLENPQIDLAAGRAENACVQAAAALRLASSRLLEGEFNAEAELLSIAKAQAELAQARKTLEEQRRKADSEETLYAAGGLSDEAIRETRFGLEAAEEQLELMEWELDIRTVGRREQDLAAAGLVPAQGFSSGEERRAALIGLATSTLRAEVEAARAQVEAAEKELESLRLAQAELTIYSPSGGIVGARYLEEGERVKQEDKLLTLIDTGSLYVVFPLREQDALKLRRGMSATVTVDGADAVYEGTVDLVSPQADSQSFTFMVRVLIPGSALAGAEATIKPGMFARIRVHLGSERDALVIPEGALLDRKNGEGTIFIVSQGRAAQRTVRFGAPLGEDREILSGLAAGEMVVLKPGAALKEGSHVIPE
ncbi:MAG: efflux RND transporter periplasmic adaptor subunit [Spirochaetaceae bacterium]|jgi:multidrug efflux pump subunit AcrA (membrane-fusion protein)|nr:efflux RND transporter periplasmic adaptor subunit [Spirochaetaceae bacterium]